MPINKYIIEAVCDECGKTLKSNDPVFVENKFHWTDPCNTPKSNKLICVNCALSEYVFGCNDKYSFYIDYDLKFKLFENNQAYKQIFSYDVSKELVENAELLVERKIDLEDNQSMIKYQIELFQRLLGVLNKGLLKEEK
jgi:hypothetical protein